MSTFGRRCAPVIALILLSCAGCSRKTLTWGGDQWGQLGLGGGGDRHQPVELTGAPAFRAVSAGSGQTLALTRSGDLWAWGYAAGEPLQGGSPSNTNVPRRVRRADGAYLTRVAKIEAGGNFNLVLMKDGSVLAWGVNNLGQLGDGTATDQQLYPVSVRDGVSGTALTDVVEIAAGVNHALAVKSDGTAWAWGTIPLGLLGTGSEVVPQRRAMPVKDPSDPTGNLTRVVQVAAGADFSLAIRADRTVVAWGGNAEGQLGDGTVNNRTTPGVVRDPSDTTGVLTAVIAIAAGDHHALAVKRGGRLMLWGSGLRGQIGDNAGVNRALPVALPDPRDATQRFRVLDASAHMYESTLAIHLDGSVWSWGLNPSGILGIGTTEEKHSPQEVMFPPGSSIAFANQISAGHAHAVLLTCRAWIRQGCNR